MQEIGLCQESQPNCDYPFVITSHQYTGVLWNEEVLTALTAMPDAQLAAAPQSSKL